VAGRQSGLRTTRWQLGSASTDAPCPPPSAHATVQPAESAARQGTSTTICTSACAEVHTVISPSAATAATARSAIACAAEDAEKVTSELFTNAIKHAGALKFDLEVMHTAGSRAVAVIVTDPSPHPPPGRHGNGRAGG
jgi:hypothetical protein